MLRWRSLLGLKKTNNKKRTLIIIGASGHGKVIADIAELNGYEDIVFLDDNNERKSCSGYEVAGKTKDLDCIEGEIIVAIGNADVRREIMQKHSKRRFPILIHPSAVIARDVVINRGSVIMAGAVINPGVRIGEGCIINTCSSVDHDCTLDSYCHIAVGAHLCGNVTIGQCVWIGAGSTISNNVSIENNVFVGAGAVVVKDLIDDGTYIGVPAKKLNYFINLQK